MTVACSIACLLVSGCNKKSKGVWDDSKTSDNYKNKNAKSLWGNDNESNLDELAGPVDGDFIPLQEEDLKSQFADGAIPQPENSPGEAGSGLPGINQFQTPSSELAAVFHPVHFNTDDHILRGRDALDSLDRVADYLKAHPHTYIFVEGHSDERGAEAYNLSLGARRANYVRTELIKKGVDMNQIHTISYGKEKPVDLGHNAQAWSKNRRADFKIYQKR